MWLLDILNVYENERDMGEMVGVFANSIDCTYYGTHFRQYSFNVIFPFEASFRILSYILIFSRNFSTRFVRYEIDDTLWLILAQYYYTIYLTTDKYAQFISFNSLKIHKNGHDHIGRAQLYHRKCGVNS